MKVPLALLLTASLAGSMVAQSWTLPVRGVVEYERVVRSKHGAVELETGKAPASAEIRNTLGLARLRNPPLLYQAELDAGQQVSTEMPTAFFDVIRHVALDFRRTTPGRVKYDLPRLMPVGDLRLTGRVGAIGAEGRQTLVFKVRSAAPAQRDGPKKYFQSYIAAHYGFAFRGELEITRQIDPAAGRILAFEASLTGEFVHPKKQRLRRSSLRHAETWTLVRVHGHRDAEFRKRVRKAIDRGAQFLRGKVEGLKAPQLRPNKASDDVVGRRSYNTGRLALCLLTMIKAEVPRDDAVLVSGMNELRRRVIYDTYSLGCAVMAMEAFYAPTGERNDLIYGVIDKPRKRRLPPGDAKLVATWCAQILDNADTRMDQGYRLAFNYTKHARYDHSVNQYGLLGLYSGHLCGVEIPAKVWFSAARHLIEQQRKEHYRIGPLQLLTYAEKRRRESDTEATRGAPPQVEPMGWSYAGGKSIGRMAYGSMTAAGVAGLTICAAGLRDLGRDRHRVLVEVTLARQRGLAFLGTNFSVRANGGWAPFHDHRRYYYLYSMERAFELAGLVEVQGRDWYHEGAMQLLAWQAANGDFRAVHAGQNAMESTAFAVLFLKKASLPVLSGK